MLWGICWSQAMWVKVLHTFAFNLHQYITEWLFLRIVHPRGRCCVFPGFGQPPWQASAAALPSFACTPMVTKVRRLSHFSNNNSFVNESCWFPKFNQTCRAALFSVDQNHLNHSRFFFSLLKRGPSGIDHKALVCRIIFFLTPQIR